MCDSQRRKRTRSASGTPRFDKPALALPCLPRATKRSVQSGGETCRRRGSTGSRPSQGSGGRSTWGLGGRARGSRPGWAVLPCAPSTRHRGAAEAPRGWARDADGQRKRAAGPQPRNKDAKQVLVEGVDRQAREMFAEVSRYTPASKNQKRQACKSRLERSALRTGLLNPHNSLPAAQTATKPSNSTLSWRWRSPHAGVTLHGHPPGPFESL